VNVADGADDLVPAQRPRDEERTDMTTPDLSATSDHGATAGTLRLGDINVSRLGFGAMRLTGRGIWGPPADRSEALRVLRRAV